MKRLMVAVLAAATLQAFAEEEKVAETEAQKVPILWGFANYGIYSGYQLYGSILNTDPTLQGYAELNANLQFDDLNLGYLGIGVWCNSDLTGRRTQTKCGVSRRAFNEIDPNIHWGRTFWFDDDNTIGLDYRTSFIWYWYPHFGASDMSKGHPPTTMDWNHAFELVNPILIPYINIVHEYHESNGNLLQFGVKKPFQFDSVEGLSVTPFIECVWRNRNYGWCFSNYGIDPEDGSKIGAGLATLKLELDATYMFSKYFGLFAKIAYCTNLDNNLREAADAANNGHPHNDYGRWNDFAWGGIGLCASF